MCRLMTYAVFGVRTTKVLTSGEQLEEAEDDGDFGRVGVAGEPGGLEDVGSVVQDGGLPRDLLEQHERRADGQRRQVALAEQLLQPCAAYATAVVRLQL